MAILALALGYLVVGVFAAAVVVRLDPWEDDYGWLGVIALFWPAWVIAAIPSLIGRLAHRLGKFSK